MGFALSPSVDIVEKDFSLIIPSVSTSVGAYAGTFAWGPILDPQRCNSETVLKDIFFKPINGQSKNITSFFTAANFLAYSTNLLVTRCDGTLLKNAVASGTAIKIKNQADYEANFSNGEASVGPWAAKYAGTLGNTLKVSMCDGATFSKSLTGTIAISGTTVTGTSTSFDTEVVAGDFLVFVKSSITYQAQVASVTDADTIVLVSNPAGTVTSGTTATIKWEFADIFQGAPGTSDHAVKSGSTNDELHIVVVDANGVFSGIKNTILERYAFVSKSGDAQKSDLTTNYYKDVMNRQSNYIHWMDHPASMTNWGSATIGTTGISFVQQTVPSTITLTGGVDDFATTDAQLIEGFRLYADDQQYDISLIPVGSVTSTVALDVIGNVAEIRKDCVVFVSPYDISTGSPILDRGSTATNKMIAYRNVLPSTSYAVMDSGVKYQYDRYNDTYRWIPLNGDVAGLCARTDYVADPWFSPGGLNRGQIKNTVKLGFNPNKTDRDELYKNGINPVVQFNGQGTVLFGDKTLLAKPGAFDRINVRRLFIVLEKAISTAAKFQLFEFNDAFTRAQFKNIVEPFLRDVQGRRGIIEFKVVCDDTNNTEEVVSRNEFVADMVIRPAYSINFITLNFVAVRSLSQFVEGA